MKSKIWLITVCFFASISCQDGSDSIRKDINPEKQKNNMELQYAYTILYVDDVFKTIEFYRNAFGFEQKMLTPEKDYGEVVSGTTTLSFANIELGNSNFRAGFKKSTLSEKPFGIELAFTTKDVEAVMDKAINNGAILLSKTIEKPWGQKVGYLRDLNGFIIEICTPVPSGGQ